MNAPNRLMTELRDPRNRPVLVAGSVILMIGVLVLFTPESPWTGIRAAMHDRVALVADIIVAPPIHATNKIDVPFYRQQHALSCEMASLRSALKAVGVEVSEAQLLRDLPKDPTRKVYASRRSRTFTWGDPDKGFVGNVNGVMPRSGYGVHATPVAELASRYASATLMRSNDAAALTAAIDAGHPVIVWSVLGKKPSKLTWKTPEGKTINAALYEHSLVVSGYERAEDGSLASVVVVDPKTGVREESWKEFTWRTSFLDHQAVEISAKN